MKTIQSTYPKTSGGLSYRRLKRTISCIFLCVTLPSCGGGYDAPSTTSSGPTGNAVPTGNSDPGDARFRITFNATWTAAEFPTNFPGNAHFSPLVGTAHNQQIVFWEADGQPATDGIESMAETGGTATFGVEIMAAQDSGLSLGVFEGSGIGSGDGETSLEFDASGTYPMITFVSMLAPSPDWFVGIRGFSLLDDQGNWKTHEEISLTVYDAGTDLGVRPNSANQDSNADSFPISLLSSDRSDTDFDLGVHFQSSKVVGIFIIDKI